MHATSHSLSWPKALGLIALTCALFGLSFPPFGIWPLIFVAWIPLFWVLDQESSLTRSMIWGALTSSGVACVAFYWVIHSVHRYGNLSLPASVLVFLLFSIICQPQLIFFSLAIPLLRERLGIQLSRLSAIQLVAIVALYAALDHWIPKLFQDSIAHALVGSASLRQNADWLGVSGLGAVVLAVQLALYQRRTIPGIAAVIGLLGLFGYGHFRLGTERERERASLNQIRVGVIQANIGDFEKIMAEEGGNAAESVVSRYLDLSRTALTQRPDWIVWPETAYPSIFQNAFRLGFPDQEHKVLDYAQESATPLLFGGYDHQSGQEFNSLFILDPLGLEPLRIYHKHILLTFGEEMPGANWFPQIREAFPQVANFGRGPGPQVYSVRSKSGQFTQVAPLICYEALFPWYSREAVQKGATLLLNITNDGWFGPYGEPYLHLLITQFRSIETHTPQLRATNTGISAYIDSTGELRQATGVETTVAPVWEIRLPAGEPTSLALRFGDWFGWIAALYLAAYLKFAPRRAL